MYEEKQIKQHSIHTHTHIYTRGRGRGRGERGEGRGERETEREREREKEKEVDLPEFGTLLLQYTHGNSTLQTDAHDLLVEKVLHF